jgi:hypothetical protein
MTTLNAYATLAEYKSFATARANSASTDATDDGVIEMLLKAASRYIDSQTSRHFYPLVQTRYFDVPSHKALDVRVLQLDDDLLEVITLVNGDGTTIPSTEYSVRPRNQSPYTALRLNDNSTYLWASNGSGSVHDVIAVTGIWGYHNRYQLAWLLGSTLAEALDTSETGFDVTSGTSFAVGNLIKIENELSYLSAVVTNTLTGTRGENGSTAAAHDTALSVYIYQYMDELKNCVLETATQAYKRRFGQSNSNTQTITGAGVILSPRDVPKMTTDFILAHRRYT